MRKTVAAVAGAALLAAACSGPRFVTDYRGGVEMFFAHAAGGKDLRAVIVGNPFPVLKAETDAYTVAAMQGRFRGPVTNLTTTPSQNSHLPARVFVIFDPSPGLHPPAVCTVRNPETLPRIAPTERLHLMVTFCEGDTLYAEVRGSAPRPASPTDPAFANLLSQAAFVLIPQDKQFGSDRNNERLFR